MAGDTALHDLFSTRYLTIPQYFAPLTEKEKRSLEAQAKLNTQFSEDPLDRDPRLGLNLRRARPLAYEGILNIVLAGESHLARIVQIMGGCGNEPYILSSGYVQGEMSKQSGRFTLECNFQHMRELDLREEMDLPELCKFMVAGPQAQKLPCLIIADTHGDDYPLSLLTSEELKGIRCVRFYAEHVSPDYAIKEYKTPAGLQGHFWIPYQKIGKQLADYAKGDINVDILGFECDYVPIKK